MESFAEKHPRDTTFSTTSSIDSSTSSLFHPDPPRRSPLATSASIRTETDLTDTDMPETNSPGVPASPPPNLRKVSLRDFQSDDVLNINTPKPPMGSAIRRMPGSPALRELSKVERSWEDDGDGEEMSFREGGKRSGAPLSWSPELPIYSPRTVFSLLGERWTREAWTKRKVALVTGITGQDGSYLTELLLAKGYIVHGIIRRSSSFNTSRLQHLYQDLHHPSSPRLILHYGDLTDSTNLGCIVSQVQPSEVYNLAAQSHVKVSFEMAEYTGNVDALGTLRLLDAIRTCGLEKLVKFYQASTSELYGKVRAVPQNEDTPFHPRSPYGVAKMYAFWSVINYREAYGMFACNGILFNHESPRRGRTFVTRKITRAVAEISCGWQECMYMGNLDAKRDWGHARDYVEGMWRILQHDEPVDFVLSSKETHSVREFIERSFAVIGTRIRWEGEGLDEVGMCEETGRVVVRVDPQYFRPAEVDLLLGDCTKAEELLGWKRKVGFEDLVREMTLADLSSVKNLVVDHN